jgi:hypothetical protein
MTFPDLPHWHPVFSITFRLRSSFSVQFPIWDSAWLGCPAAGSNTSLSAGRSRFTVSAKKGRAASSWGGEFAQWHHGASRLATKTSIHTSLKLSRDIMSGTDRGPVQARRSLTIRQCPMTIAKTFMLQHTSTMVFITRLPAANQERYHHRGHRGHGEQVEKKQA